MYHRNHPYIREISCVFTGYPERSPDFLLRTYGLYNYEDYYYDDGDDYYFASFERYDSDDLDGYDYDNFCEKHFDDDSKDYDDWHRS